MKYLVVDDHEPFRKIIWDFLPESNPDVVECGNGAEVLKLFEEERPDWVLMDIEMPGMDGLTALKVLRKRHPGARAIILTQYDNPRLRKDAFSAGATAFIRKENLVELREVLLSASSTPNQPPSP